MLTCKDCDVSFPKTHKTGRPSLYCPDCKLERMRAKGRADQKRLRDRRGYAWQREVTLGRYGLTPASYNEMLAAQGGGCAVCGTPDVGGRWDSTAFHVDHDHATGVVRGLLCLGCNRGLGYFNDNPEKLRLAALYLERVS